jgi:hypothetical protein
MMCKYSKASGCRGGVSDQILWWRYLAIKEALREDNDWMMADLVVSAL